MRFVVQHKKALYINFLIFLYSIGIYFFIISFGAYKFLSKEFFPQDILLSIKGNPDEFLESKSLLSIMESVHIELFLLLTVFITLFSVFIRTNFSEFFKINILFWGSFFIFLYFMSVFGIKYLSDYFSNIYFISLIAILLNLFLINSLNIYCFLAGKVK
jgi:hypothetical protein